MGSALREKTQFGAQMHTVCLLILTQEMMRLSISGSDLLVRVGATQLIIRI